MQVTVDFDDSLYSDLLQKVGKDNISQFIQAVVRPQLYISNSFKKSAEKSDLVNGLTLEQRREKLQSLSGAWEGDITHNVGEFSRVKNLKWQDWQL